MDKELIVAIFAIVVAMALGMSGLVASIFDPFVGVFVVGGGLVSALVAIIAILRWILGLPPKFAVQL